MTPTLLTHRDSIIRSTRLFTSTAAFLGTICALTTLVMVSGLTANAGISAFKQNQLFVDEQPVPQLFGAEVQYFRLRGGHERNIPRAQVIALWNQALDRLVEAGANTISFYIPWDFHEYAPGKFDFDGTADEDGDGKPDFPSRDLKTWFKLIEAHGIKHIMVRPGPYINAEWGFLGFGAVPVWFHEKYPDSHMQNAQGQRVGLYGYGDADFLRESRAWMQTLYREVLAEHIGPGKPIDFLQLDNETNFQWQSIYNVDYSPRAIRAYQAFLESQYGSVLKLNSATGRNWGGFQDVKAPTTAGVNLAEDRDWYRFQDDSIHTFLHEIRKIWEDLGVREPQVVFTLAESYNAASHGLLPNYRLRNDPGVTGLMTVNLYPKTVPTSALLNQPFKADHDVKADSTANQYYFGNHTEWTLGPEIQGGWWRGTDVSKEARQQTYLTTIGHGLKALYVYYFNEGPDWDYDWAKKQLTPHFDQLRADPRFKDFTLDQLPGEFWDELNLIFANKVLAGWDARTIYYNGGTQPKDLYFDAPLDGNAQARPPYELLKTIGQKLVVPYGSFLGRASEMTDPVCLVKDPDSNAPSPLPDIDSTLMNSYWAGGLVAYFLQTGINIKILHLGLNPSADFEACQLVLYQDNGVRQPTMIEFLGQHLKRGGSVMGFVGTQTFDEMIAKANAQATCHPVGESKIAFNANECLIGNSRYYQVRNPVYANFNSDNYAEMLDVPARRAFLAAVLADLHIQPRLQIKGGGDRVVAFARTVPGQANVWVTVKSGQLAPTSSQIIFNDARPEASYHITRLIDGGTTCMSGADLKAGGFAANLGASGSDVFMISRDGKK